MTSLDELTRQAQAGTVTTKQLIEAFLDTMVMMPSASDPQTVGLKPVLVRIEDIPHVVVATGDKGLERTRSLSTHAMTILGRNVLAGAQPGSGILVNTEDSGFTIHPEVLQTALEDYDIKSLHDE